MPTNNDDVKGRVLAGAIGGLMAIAGAGMTWGAGPALLTAGICTFAFMICLELANLALRA